MYPRFQKSLEKRKTGPLDSTTTSPRSGTKCSTSLYYINLSDIFRQLKYKHLYVSDIRQPESPTVNEKVRDKNFTQFLIGKTT